MAQKLVVLGHHPAYLDLAKKLGADAFSLPPEIWDSMDATDRWAANKEFLDRAIADGAVFVLATPLKQIRPTYFALELEYLISLGYVGRRGSTHWELAR